VVSFPALMTSDAAFVRIVSCNPLEVRGDDIPPTFSGLAMLDRSEWAGFLEESDRVHGETWTEFNEWCLAQGTPPLLPRELMHASPVANIYVFPRELDYLEARPLDETWHRIDSSVRETDEDYALPAEVTGRPEGSGLIYLSLGSLGGADVGLMQRLVDVLATSPHRVIVSMGPRADELRLADNMAGAATLPQTKVIPQVDLVITHGGNNTTTEAMHFGKPMVVLPLFWDQYDNAQRVHEKGFGVRLSTYAFADGELTGAVDRLLADTLLRERMAAIGAGIRDRDGLRTGAEIIEQVGLAHRSSAG
jgi:MGT family glycosyltransferase